MTAVKMGKCYSPTGVCDQTTCFDRCAWDGVEQKKECCGHVHSEQAGGVCVDCPDSAQPQNNRSE